MDTYEAKELLANSIRCLAMSMEQIRLRETEKCVDLDEPMQDHLAQCTHSRVPYECTSVEDCCKYLLDLYKGFKEAADHTILKEEIGSERVWEVCDIADMVMGMIGHGFSDNLMNCAEEIYQLAEKLVPSYQKSVKSEEECKRVLKEFVTETEQIIINHHLQTWNDGTYSLPLGYLHDWMKRRINSQIQQDNEY